MVGGFLGGIVPDSKFVDPSRGLGPNHRRFGHSWALLGVTVYVADAAISAWEKFCRQQADIIAERLVSAADITGFARVILIAAEIFWRFTSGLLGGFLAGYTSHLTLDALTAKSLPIFGSDFGNNPLVAPIITSTTVYHLKRKQGTAQRPLTTSGTDRVLNRREPRSIRCANRV